MSRLEPPIDRLAELIVRLEQVANRIENALKTKEQEEKHRDDSKR